MTLDIGKLLKNTSEIGSTFERRQREVQRRTGTHDAPITFWQIVKMQRSGTLSVHPEEWVEIVGNFSALRRYTAGPDFPVKEGVLQLEGPAGRVDVCADASIAAGTHRWSALREEQAPMDHAKCSYCGAPGQRIGTRCEYCQVAVSR